MKTAVSIPDNLFRKADSLAKSMEITRNELYAKAIATYVAQHDDESVTERLNLVYKDQQSVLDPILEKMQILSLPAEPW